MKHIPIQLIHENTKAKLEVDLNVFDLNTIKQSVYKFMDRCSFGFEQIESKLFLNIEFHSMIQSDEMIETINKIQNEFLDQDLRRIVSAETEQVRNLILANAFSNTKLIEPDEL